MRALSDSDILRLWENGNHLHPIDRALHILDLAWPERTREELIALTVGRRNAALIAVRSQTVGSKLYCFTNCGSCRAQLDFELDAAAMAAGDYDTSVDQPCTVETDGVQVRFRLPDSRDLAAIAQVAEVSEARSRLIDRCVQFVGRDGEDLPPEEMTDDLLTAVTERIEQLDPLSTLNVELVCAECGHEWSMVLDIVSYFWTELAHKARRLLTEVHTLARAYGWREDDILAMNPVRRRAYLEMVQ